MVKTPIRINFGTDGFRGIIGDNFTFDAVRHISLSLGEFIKQNPLPVGTYDKESSPVEKNKVNCSNKIAVGYDTRFLSREFAVTAAEAISSLGFKVFLCDGFCPSPVLSYFVAKNNCRAGIMITASHNPYMFNGIKFKSSHGSSMLQGDVKKVEDIANTMPFVTNRKPGGISYGIYDSIPLYLSGKDVSPVRFDFKPDYLEHIVRFTGFGDALFSGGRGNKISKSVEVVFDPMFGAGAGYLTHILKRFNVRYHILNGSVNPSFPGIDPEPIDKNLKKLKTRLRRIGKTNKFAVGFATDGDADRIGAVDHEGNFVDSHKIFSIILNFLLQEGYEGNVVKTVSVSKSIDYICKKFGVRLFEVPIGFKNIAELMIKKENNIFMGGEESGGIGITSHIPERDGILNALILLKIMIIKGKSLKELLCEIFGSTYPYIYERKDLHINEDRKLKAIELLKKGSFKLPDCKNIVSSNFSDGFKFEYKDKSWLLIRPSGTESLLRIYAEGSESARVNMLIKTVEEELLLK